MAHTVHHERIPSSDRRLNRHIHHDSRSKLYRFDTTDLKIESAVHERHIPILDQGQVGSCTANAGIGTLATDPYYSTLLTIPKLPFTFDEAGALDLYSDAEQEDGNGPYPPNDDGSSGLTIAKVLKAKGLISGMQHTFSLDDCLKALSKTPVMLGVSWLQKMFSPDADGRLRLGGKVAGGHEIESREIDAVNERVWIDNSWNESFGVKGRAYLTFVDLGKLLDMQGDVTILTPLSQPAPTPSAEIAT